MAGTVSPGEAKKANPNFFKDRPDNVNWTLHVIDDQGKRHEFVGVDWVVTSRFGRVTSEVVIGPNGQPQFDRPAYHEAPNVNVIAWGRDARTGEVKIAIITEERPHADHPEKPDSSVPLKFAQIPMGFMDKIIGSKGLLTKLEMGKTAAIREIEEETGASAVRGWTQPACPWHNPSPSFVATWSSLYFVEVDLERVGEIKETQGEQIFKAEYLPVRELLARIREGQSKDEAIFRACTSLSLLMIFFACYPEFWPS